MRTREILFLFHLGGGVMRADYGTEELWVSDPSMTPRGKPYSLKRTSRMSENRKPLLLLSVFFNEI